MYKLFQFILIITISHTCFAQVPKPEVFTQKIQVNVSVMNSKELPLAGEEILFLNKRTHSLLSNRTDAQGKFSIYLNPGENYSIRIQTMTDTVEYSDFETPLLRKGDQALKSIGIDVIFEPAKVYTLKHVYFDNGKSTIKTTSFKQLDEIAAYMKTRMNEQYEIGGHTDNSGNITDNLTLSEKRAESVRAYLIKKGIDQKRIISKGFGSKYPVAENNSPEGKQKNRRTEVKII
ncbi:MAG: hypothetical protein JWP69_2240 [Flaviaesturariibacter sp.]|nr:hypothetical protein [Flaviaesturariibacter sp.]